MKKDFNTSGPHEHGCSHCYATIHCRATDCEIPQFAECLECQRISSGVEHFDYDTSFFRNASGYRKSWPGRFAVEHYTLPLSERRSL